MSHVICPARCSVSLGSDNTDGIMFISGASRHRSRSPFPRCYLHSRLPSMCNVEWKYILWILWMCVHTYARGGGLEVRKIPKKWRTKSWQQRTAVTTTTTMTPSKRSCFLVCRRPRPASWQSSGLRSLEQVEYAKGTLNVSHTRTAQSVNLVFLFPLFFGA